MLFRLSQVGFGYPAAKQAVFERLDLEVPVGLTILRGPSGGGKSTLLKLMTGYLPTQQGRIVTRHGRPPDRQFRRFEAGFVFQQFNLLPGTSLRKNLELAGLVAGVSGAPLKAAIEHWLSRLGLVSLADARVNHLSGGQVQRAALARALVKRPSVLLLDEPTSGLDDASTGLIGKILGEELAEGRSVIVSTHDPRLASAIGTEARLALSMPFEG